MKEGLAGKIAKVFMTSKLTVLLMIVFMVIGVYSSFLIPREEEPQIDVPMETFLWVILVQVQPRLNLE